MRYEVHPLPRPRRIRFCSISVYTNLIYIFSILVLSLSPTHRLSPLLKPSPKSFTMSQSFKSSTSLLLICPLLLLSNLLILTPSAVLLSQPVESMTASLAPAAQKVNNIHFLPDQTATSSGHLPNQTATISGHFTNQTATSSGRLPRQSEIIVPFPRCHPLPEVPLPSVQPATGSVSPPAHTANSSAYPSRLPVAGFTVRRCRPIIMPPVPGGRLSNETLYVRPVVENSNEAVHHAPEETHTEPSPTGDAENEPSVTRVPGKALPFRA